MKIAIVLFNLGGPDSLEAVQPFLRNLFSDPAIIRLPALLRRRWRASSPAGARRWRAEIYEKIGGGSPILARPRRRRARSKKRWAASTNGAAMSACATGIR